MIIKVFEEVIGDDGEETGVLTPYDTYIHPEKIILVKPEFFKKNLGCKIITEGGEFDSPALVEEVVQKIKHHQFLSRNLQDSVLRMLGDIEETRNVIHHYFLDRL
jgi:hypothetical protein